MRQRFQGLLAAAAAVVVGVAACGGEPVEQGQQEQASPQGRQAEVDVAAWQPVGAALGMSGEAKEGGVFRVSMPRSDLEVRVGEVGVKPSFALGSYAAFLGTPDDALVVGDLVLLEAEVNPVLSGLQAAGLQATALHRHLLGEEPNVMFLHYEGRGKAVDLAGGIRQALSASATPLSPSPKQPPAPLSFDTARLDQIIGYRGEAKSGGVWGYSIGRARPVTLHGFQLPASSGVATALNFQDLGGGRAAINGDFAMMPGEVDGVLRALREAGIAVEATHQHMLHDQPHLIYTHFWATGPAEQLAEGLRAALGHVDVAPPNSG